MFHFSKKYIIIGLTLFLVVFAGSYYMITNVKTSPVETTNDPENPFPTRAVAPETTLMPTVSMEEQMKFQEQADYDYGQWQSQIYADYPWYDRLPLQNDKYYVYFDLDDKKFHGTLYSQDNPEALKQEIYSILRGYGVAVESFTFIWD